MRIESSFSVDESCVVAATYTRSTLIVYTVYESIVIMHPRLWKTISLAAYSHEFRWHPSTILMEVPNRVLDEFI